jgi:hypothetical protein
MARYSMASMVVEIRFTIAKVARNMHTGKYLANVR